jgi:hypothetical protein
VENYEPVMSFGEEVADIYDDARAATSRPPLLS